MRHPGNLHVHLLKHERLGCHPFLSPCRNEMEQMSVYPEDDEIMTMMMGKKGLSFYFSGNNIINQHQSADKTTTKWWKSKEMR